MVIRNSSYQRSIFLSSINLVSGKILETSGKMVEFFKLSETNKNLNFENTQLINRVTELENQLSTLTDTIKPKGQRLISFTSPEREHTYIPAKVIRISINQNQNFITLNKGAKDGIKEDMGVISDQGLVGIVEKVSTHFSKVIPVINPKLTIIAKFTKNNHFGSIVWDGEDYKYTKLNDIARHIKFSLGDTIVTGGFKTFPEGVVIGTVDNFELKDSESYYNIDVKLGVDFKSLTYVKVIDYKNYNEQKELEEE